MRGTPICMVCRLDKSGIIPAYAGNTVSTISSKKQCRDHPRVCGEHLSHSADGNALPGSSPRMRGTRTSPRTRQTFPGIIPAYAGNTYSTVNVHVAEWDHPRVCGEHLIGIRFAIRCTGSSPRMRGTRLSVGFYLCVVGIIPAYAGNTRRESFRR